MYVWYETAPEKVILPVEVDIKEKFVQVEISEKDFVTLLQNWFDSAEDSDFINKPIGKVIKNNLRARKHWKYNPRGKAFAIKNKFTGNDIPK